MSEKDSGFHLSPHRDITRVFRRRLIAWTAILAALLVVPAPLLPPHRFAEVLQSISGVMWPAAYLVAAVTLQGSFYFSLGALAGCCEKRQSTYRFRMLQAGIVTTALLCAALIIRSVKAGHPPVWVNAAVPVASCLVGILSGVGFLYRRMKATVIVLTLVMVVSVWGLVGGRSGTLRDATQAELMRMTAAAPMLPPGDARFGFLLRTAFTAQSSNLAAVRQNRAAIAALGICIGHRALARLVGIDPDSQLVDQAVRACAGTTLQGREDWARHYTLSGALAVLNHPLVSEAGGLMKEQLDALTEGSGFSFGDLAADTAGVRFAMSATSSESSATAMKERLQAGFAANDFFPPELQFPENMSLEMFRHRYGGVGSQKYRDELEKIEYELNRCAALNIR